MKKNTLLLALLFTFIGMNAQIIEFKSSKKLVDGPCSITEKESNFGICILKPYSLSFLSTALKNENIVWYADASHSTLLSTNTILQDGKKYYGEEKKDCRLIRHITTVVTYETSLATLVDINIPFCTGDQPSLASLLKFVDNQWLDTKIYAAASGGEPLPLTTTITNDKTFYLSFDPIKTNDCAAFYRVPISVTFNQCLNNTDFNYNDQLSIYPNPVENELNIQSTSDTEITAFEIYTFQGQLVISSQNPQNKINTSNLPKGMYIINVQTNKGTLTEKFVK